MKQTDYALVANGQLRGVNMKLLPLNLSSCSLFMLSYAELDLTTNVFVDIWTLEVIRVQG